MGTFKTFDYKPTDPILNIFHLYKYECRSNSARNLKLALAKIAILRADNSSQHQLSSQIWNRKPVKVKLYLA